MRAFKDEEEAPAPAVPMPNSGPKSGDYVTVVTTPKPCGKRAWLDSEDQIQFESRGDMVAGTARTVHVPDPESLLALLSDLSDHQYVIPDFVPETVGLDSFALLTQGEHKRHYPDADLAPVTQAGRVYVCLNPDDWYFGNWRILDRDVDADTPDKFRVAYDEWLEQVDHLLPGVLNAPRVYWPSSKARAQKADGSSVESLNGHTWIKCEAESVANTDAMRGRLRLRAVALGMAWFVPRMSRKTGKPLPGKGVPKTILDVSVWSIHRAIYAGAPTVGEGLRLLPSQGFALEGVAIDLRTALPEPTAATLECYSERTGAQVEVSGKGTITITDRGTLTLDDEVLIKDHDKPVTLRDFWSDPAFAFGAKYRCQTIVRESSSWNGILRKFAGGTIMHYDNGTGIDYLLDVNARAIPEVEPVAQPEYSDPVTRRGEMPFPPGLAGDIAAFAMTSFRMPNPEFAIACALMTLSVINANRHYVGASNTSLNLYTCLVAETGKGKEDPRKLLKQLIDNAGSSVEVMETLASGPALLRTLQARRRVAICTDEFGLVLQSALGKNGSVPTQELLRELMSLHGLGRSFYGGKHYADEKRNIGRIDEPYVCLMGTTTPSTLADGLSPESVDSGFLNRLLVVVQTGDAQVNRKQTFTPPEELVKRLRALGPPAPPERQTSVALVYASGAEDELVRLVESHERTAQVPALWARAEEQAIRVAGCVALGDGGEIRSEHVAWSAEWMRRGLMTLEKMVREDMHSSPFEKQSSRVLKMIRNAKSYGNDTRFGTLCVLGYMPRGKLIKNSKLRPVELDQVTKALVEAGEITEQKADGQTVYTAISDEYPPGASSPF
jgi:hypothetical protein